MNLWLHFILFGLAYCNGIPSSDSSNDVLDGALLYGIPLEARQDSRCGKLTSSFVTDVGKCANTGSSDRYPESKESPQKCWEYCIKPDAYTDFRGIVWKPNECGCVHKKYLNRCKEGSADDWELYDSNPKHCNSIPECDNTKCCDTAFGATDYNTYYNGTDWTGRSCEAYDGAPDECDGTFDDDDFQIAKMCCVCGGGYRPDQCVDSNKGVKDSEGWDCGSYYGWEEGCGESDHDDFKANDMCCFCGGGSKQCKDEFPSTCTYPPNYCAKLLKTPERRAKWCDKPLSSRKKCASDATGLIRDHCTESCKVCTPTDHCTDGRINGDETEIDCGGNDCPTCKRQCGKTTSSFVTKVGKYSNTGASDEEPKSKESPQNCWDFCIKPDSRHGWRAIAWKEGECGCIDKRYLPGGRILGNADDWEYYDFNPKQCTSTPAGCNANECCDLNFGATDMVEKGCDAADCTGGWDDDDFQAEKMCCKCGGGTTTLE